MRVYIVQRSKLRVGHEGEEGGTRAFMAVLLIQKSQRIEKQKLGIIER